MTLAKTLGSLIVAASAIYAIAVINGHNPSTWSTVADQVIISMFALYMGFKGDKS